MGEARPLAKVPWVLLDFHHFPPVTDPSPGITDQMRYSTTIKNGVHRTPVSSIKSLCIDLIRLILQPGMLQSRCWNPARISPVKSNIRFWTWQYRRGPNSLFVNWFALFSFSILCPFCLKSSKRLNKDIPWASAKARKRTDISWIYPGFLYRMR